MVVVMVVVVVAMKEADCQHVGLIPRAVGFTSLLPSPGSLQEHLANARKPAKGTQRRFF